MKAFSIIVPLIVVFSALGGRAQVVSTGPKVDAEYDRQGDFSRYGSYAWMPSQKPADNMANHIRFTRAISKEMEALGFRVDTVKPDVRVQYRVHTSSKVQADSSQKRSAFDSANLKTDFVFATGTRRHYGTLIVEMYDANTNVLLWRATTTRELPTPDKAEKAINEVVKTVFTAYPTRRTKS